MDFVTQEYYSIFLPIVVIAVLFVARKKRNLQVTIMLLMSYIFFWLASGWHVLLLLTSTLVDWTAGKKIASNEKIMVKKRWLYGSLSINLGILAIFKYLDFFIESWNLILVHLVQYVGCVLETIKVCLKLRLTDIFLFS